MSADTDTPVVRNNEAENRFEIEEDGQLAVLEYVREADVITYVHTKMPPDLRGMGLGGKLARYALEYAREMNLKVIPVCPFVQSYLERHPEYQSLVLKQPEE
ncbi:MAG: N-acetyltransferase [Ardenticatenaceae bacterium]|nr:N-acetyltransferase [Ardenticatenaceae bacterium]MCB8987738.1 N-acetyltransferase [Ardenticatenaceae bacterium]